MRNAGLVLSTNSISFLWMIGKLECFTEYARLVANLFIVFTDFRHAKFRLSQAMEIDPKGFTYISYSSSTMIY